MLLEEDEEDTRDVDSVRELTSVGNSLIAAVSDMAGFNSTIGYICK